MAELRDRTTAIHFNRDPFVIPCKLQSKRLGIVRARQMMFDNVEHLDHRRPLGNK
jgi:hypothetical protein